MIDVVGRLFVLRHGEAQTHAASDASRQLTDFGRYQVRARAATFAPELSTLNCIYVSPYLRARQTADELCAELQYVGPRVEVDWLTPDTPISRVLAELKPLMVDAPILLVSHQPLVSYLVGHLTGKPAWEVNMDTASLACLEVSTATMPDSL